MKRQLRNKLGRLAVWVVAMLLLQGGVYLYLDRFLLTPSSPFQMQAITGPGPAGGGGEVYYSFDHRYLAVLASGQVKIYEMPGNKLVRRIDLQNKQISYFRWLEDRNIALLGYHYDTGSGGQITLIGVDPQHPRWSIPTTIKALPMGSKITDVAYSTATNVIYLKVQTAPDNYRVYRTDANHKISRVYLNTRRLGEMAVLFTRDCLVYEDLPENAVKFRLGDGSWGNISPPVGKYRLERVSGDQVYLTRLDSNQPGSRSLLFKAEDFLKSAHRPAYSTPPTQRRKSQPSHHQG